VIVTTVHELQVLDEELPEDDHDFRVDFVVTPNRIIQCEAPRRPDGLLWESLSADKIAAIPVLKQMAATRIKLRENK
jgi:5-formyltetrahydrofolate cyclo-ligase